MRGRTCRDIQRAFADIKVGPEIAVLSGATGMRGRRIDAEGLMRMLAMGRWLSGLLQFFWGRGRLWPVPVRLRWGSKPMNLI